MLMPAGASAIRVHGKWPDNARSGKWRRTCLVAVDSEGVSSSTSANDLIS